MKRREFVKAGLLGGAALALGGSTGLLAGMTDVAMLTILHTNDTHSRIDAYPANDPRFPNMGGYARRAAAISRIRQEAEQVLLLDAGDIFQGTAYYNVYGGEPELRLMSKMGYDAATMGNHEFDNGLEGFLKVLPHAAFPFICSNYDFSQTILQGKTLSSKVFKKGNMRVGVYGLGIQLQGLVSPGLYQNTVYHEPLKVALETEKNLKEKQGCELIICLSHLGYEYENDQVSDRHIAQNTRYTDIILGGHTHSILNPAVQLTNAAGHTVTIGQTGYGGVRLGRMNVYLDRKSGDKFVEAATTNILKNQAT